MQESAEARLLVAPAASAQTVTVKLFMVLTI